MSTTSDDENESPAGSGSPGAVPPAPPADAPAGGSYPPPPEAGAYPPPSGSGGYPPPTGSGAYPPLPSSGGYAPPTGSGGYPPSGAAGGYPPPGYGPGGPAGQGPGGYGPPPAPGYPPAAYTPGAPLSPSDQRLWAVLGHLGNLLVWILAPLVIWLVFRGRGAFLEDHAKESVNFQITAAIAAAALTIVTVVTLGIGALLFIPFGIAWLVFIIIAAVKASQGEPYRYPLTLRLVK